MTHFCMNPCWVGSDQVQVNFFSEKFSSYENSSQTLGLDGELQNKMLKEKRKIHPKKKFRPKRNKRKYKKQKKQKRKQKKQKRKQKLGPNSNLQSQKNRKRRTKESKNMYF